MLHGNKDFSLDVPYVQSSDEANSLMSWLTQRIMKPRNSIGLKIFSLPTMQLGDIVKIDYLDNNIDVLESFITPMAQQQVLPHRQLRLFKVQISILMMRRDLVVQDLPLKVGAMGQMSVLLVMRQLWEQQIQQLLHNGKFPF